MYVACVCEDVCMCVLVCMHAHMRATSPEFPGSTDPTHQVRLSGVLGNLLADPVNFILVQLVCLLVLNALHCKRRRNCEDLRLDKLNPKLLGAAAWPGVPNQASTPSCPLSSLCFTTRHPLLQAPCLLTVSRMMFLAVF